MGSGAGRLVAKYGLLGLVVLGLGLLGLSSPRGPRPHVLGPATRRALSLRGGAGSAQPGQDVPVDEMERLVEEMGRLSPAQREKLLDELSGGLPTVTPGAHYPGIDVERGGILPARVQTIRKDILDVDVDDTRLDDSVLCDRDSIFNTSATPARPEIAPEQSHYCVPDPKAFTNLPPVQMDVEDLAQFDYDFSESSEASGHAARRQQRASVVGARARRNLTEAEQADVDAATAKVRAGLEELPQEERDEMKQLVEYLQTYMTLSGINIILLLGRILKLMDFQPRLGVITHTLALATVDLIHFFIIFILIFMGFAFIGHVIFGYVSSHFNDMTSSVNSLFQNLLGDITYFLEDFKNFDGVNFVVGMIYFYAFNIFVLMIMFNFLLAIICDAFGEVKANASESVGVHVELGPMLADSWKSAFRSFYKNHVPEARVRKQLRIWAGQEESSDSEDELEEHDDVRVFKYDDTKELDAAGLRRVLRRCVVETYQRSAEAKFLLGGSRNRNRDALATAEEIEAAADMLLAQVGDVAEPAEDEDEGPSEIEALQTSLEKLLKAQQKLVEGQVKVIEGQARMADRQERLSDLEQKILGVLAKPPEQL